MANYDINYDDTRFQKVESEKNAALSDLEKTYANMANQSDKFYQQQIDANKAWEEKQTQLQQQQTDFAIDKIEQEKAQAKKDYTKEQSGAYVDWQKQSNQFGANAEQMAAQGMTNTGFSESAQVSMFNTYQNRVATARESYMRIVSDFNNKITEARLQNNSVLAEIAFESQQKRLELALQGFQYKNALIQEKTDKKMQLDSEYHSRYQDVLKQINTENALAEEVRQYNESKALEREKLAEEKRQFNETMAYNKSKSSGSSGGNTYVKTGGSGGKSISGGSVGSKSASAAVVGGISGSGKSKSGDLPKATAQSILNLGGPYKPEYVAQQVKSGKVTQTKNKNGDTVFVKTPFGAGSATLNPQFSVKKASTATNLKRSIKNALKGINGWFGG